MVRKEQSHARVLALFVRFTFLKMGGWAVLQIRGVRAFAGDNAATLYIPIAKSMLAEHRFNGPDSRPGSKVPPAYPLLVAAAMGILYWLAVRIRACQGITCTIGA